MGSKTRLISYCTKRGDNTVNLVTSRKTIARLARPISILNYFKWTLMDIKYVRYIGYVMPSAHGPCFVVRSFEKKSDPRSEVSAHGPIICCNQLQENIGAIFNRSKSQRTRTDFQCDTRRRL